MIEVGILVVAIAVALAIMAVKVVLLDELFRRLEGNEEESE